MAMHPFNITLTQETNICFKVKICLFLSADGLTFNDTNSRTGSHLVMEFYNHYFIKPTSKYQAKNRARA